MRCAIVLGLGCLVLAACVGGGGTDGGTHPLAAPGELLDVAHVPASSPLFASACQSEVAVNEAIDERPLFEWLPAEEAAF